MDFQLSAGDKKLKCPKCDGRRMTKIMTGGNLFLKCSCGWSRLLKQGMVETPNQNVNPDNIMKR